MRISFNDYDDMLKHVENVKIGVEPITLDLLSAMVDVFSYELDTACEAAHSQGYDDGKDSTDGKVNDASWNEGYNEGYRDALKEHRIATQ